MNSNKIPLREALFLAIGEFTVGAIICAVYIIIGSFDYKVLLGALLGVCVTILNFVFICITVNRAVDNCLSTADFSKTQPLPPTEAVDNNSEEDPYDDETAKFARENQGKLANAIKLSYIVRSVVMAVSLIVAFITKQFNLIATLIPLLMFKPILSLSAILKRKEK